MTRKSSRNKGEPAKQYQELDSSTEPSKKPAKAKKGSKRSDPEPESNLPLQEATNSPPKKAKLDDDDEESVKPKRGRKKKDEASVENVPVEVEMNFQIFKKINLKLNNFYRRNLGRRRKKKNRLQHHPVASAQPK